MNIKLDKVINYCIAIILGILIGTTITNMLYEKSNNTEEECNCKN